MLDIDVKGLQSLISALEQSGHDVAPAVEAGLDVAAKRVLSQKQREIAKTYAREIPRSKNGNPKWQRSGDFARDAVVLRDPGQRTVTQLGNSEVYEERLATLPRGADGINRSNPASERAYDVTEPQVQALIEAEIFAFLKL